MPALARWSFAAAAAAPSPRETTRPSRCRAALRRPAKTAAGGGGWTSASFPSSRPRPRHVARAYAPARPGSSDEERVEWDDTCAAGRTETPATPSSRGKPLLCFVNGKSGGRRGAALIGVTREPRRHRRGGDRGSDRGGTERVATTPRRGGARPARPGVRGRRDRRVGVAGHRGAGGGTRDRTLPTRRARGAKDDTT